MTKHGKPVIIPDPAALPLSLATMGDVLDREAYPDLFRLVEEEGLPYFARLNAQGNVELFLVFDQVETFSQETGDEVHLEWKTYQDKLLAIIWTVSDPIQPLGFPLTFDIKRPEHHFMALRLMEQPSIPLHHLAFQNGMLIHIYSEELRLEEGERERVRLLIDRLASGEYFEETVVRDEEIREEPSVTVSARELPDSVLVETGKGFLIHYENMKQRLGEEQAQTQLMQTVHAATLVMRRHPRSEVRESRFTVWAAERSPYAMIAVTPGLDDLFELIHMSEDESHPFVRFVLALPDFVETQDVQPLRWGAYPIMRYENGKVVHVDLDETIQEKLRDLHQQTFPQDVVPY